MRSISWLPLVLAVLGACSNGSSSTSGTTTSAGSSGTGTGGPTDSTGGTSGASTNSGGASTGTSSGTTTGGGASTGSTTGTTGTVPPSTNGGTAVVDGTVADRPFAAANAIFSSSVPDSPGLVVQISDFGGACSEQDAGTLVVSGQVLLITLALQPSQGVFTPITAPGTYPIVPLDPSSIPSAFSFMAYDFAIAPHCSPDGDYAGQTGSVTIDAIAADAVSGSFDVTLQTVFGLPDAGTPHLTGTFDAVSCAWMNPANTTCQ